MTKLSIIICVYNTDVAKFDECLQSVFNSILKDLEVIVIDDGSSVDYSSIVDKFNIKYFKTENRGTLRARMFGVSKASSPYVCFVDSDDTISFNFLEASLVRAEKTNADIVINDWAFHTDSTRYLCANDSTIKTDFLLNDYEVLDRFFGQAGAEHSYYVLWNKIYKREILSYAVKEIEKLNIGHLVYAEDVLINYFSFKHARLVTNVHLGYYFYRVHGDQQISIKSNEKLLNHVNSMSFVFDTIENDLKNTDKYDMYCHDLNMWKRLLSTSHYNIARSFKDSKLCDDILSIYGINNFKPYKNESAYTKHRLLPNNICEIDNILRNIYDSDKNEKIYAKKNSYAYLTLQRMKNIFGIDYTIVSNKKNADIIMPKEIISFKQRILHNVMVYKVGMFLFPKGSKIRNFLKRKI